MEIKLYTDDLAADPAVLDTDLTYRVQGMRFSTKLHGGFNICSFNLKADLPEAWQWITKKMFYRLVVSDESKILWEGRLEDIAFNLGGVSVTAYGYYANLSDIPYRTAYNAVASVVIKAVLTANCAQISSDQTHIDATDVTITSAAGDDYLDIYPQQLVEKLLAFGDTSDNKWYFAIWEDRIAWLFARSVSTADWKVDLSNFNGFTIKHRGGDLWNSVYAIYDVAGTLTRTADADDATSQSKYFERQYVVPQLGTVAAAAAQAQRDTFLAEHKDIWPKMTDMVLGKYMFNTEGIRYPSAWLRAGDVLMVRDLVPATGMLDSVTRDALRTFYIVETEYDVDRAELRIVPDTENTSLDAVLGRTL